MRRVPALLNLREVRQVVSAMVADLTLEAGGHHLEGAADRFLATLACRTAIHVHRRLTLPGDGRPAAAMELRSAPISATTGADLTRLKLPAAADQLFLRVADSCGVRRRRGCPATGPGTLTSPTGVGKDGLGDRAG